MPMANVKDKSKSWTLFTSSKNDLEELVDSNLINVRVILEGSPPGPGEWLFFAIFNGQIVLEDKWGNGLILESQTIGLDLMDLRCQQQIAEVPLICILRSGGGKISKDLDPLLNINNYAGATFDLLPLVLGEEEVNCRAEMVLINSGERSNCYVECFAKTNSVCENSRVPLMISLLSAHCLPATKDGTVYLAAIGVNHLLVQPSVNFGMSLSSANASKIVWSSVINAGQAANTMLGIPDEDKFIPKDFETNDCTDCNSVYWNSMRRVLVDPIEIQNSLLLPFYLEIAGVPKLGKIEVRGRYMCFVDASVLLESGQCGVTTCAKLLYYNEYDMPQNVKPLLDLPLSSAKTTARDTNIVLDEQGHNAYIEIRFDLYEPLVPKTKMSCSYERIGFPLPDKSSFSVDNLEKESLRDDTAIDIKRIQKEGGAIAVHNELTGLAYRGCLVPMNQGIKKTAANKLLMRVRMMLKQFPVNDYLLIDWQDAITSQHAASRRAITASFEPQPPAARATSINAAARCRQAGDIRLADLHIINNVKIMGKHDQPLLIKTLRLLEDDNYLEARNYLFRAMHIHIRNKFLLWIFGAQEFNKGVDGYELSSAAFRIALKGDSSDGVTNAIGWAALHALNHFHDNMHAAFIAGKRMRKSYELPKEWSLFYERWIERSGAEESLWCPSTISPQSPLLVAAALFLCLRCYDFSNRLLECYENKCDTRGSRIHNRLQNEFGPDAHYIRTASHLIRREYDKALFVLTDGIKRFGPSAKMSQMNAVCLACVRDWDAECEAAIIEAEKAGASACPLLLLKAARSIITIAPHNALQRAARVHKIFPSAHSALTIGRAYQKMGEKTLAERWASVAVNMEPMLADGWAFLAILATYQRDPQKARVMLRTARQVGPISSDLDAELKKVEDVIPIESLPETLAKDLCYCDYY